MLALKVEADTKEEKPIDNPPVDLVYLSSLSMGDSALETEILGMFASQLPIYLDSLCGCDDPLQRKAALHTLKGAARSVGAVHLSEIAAMLENDASVSNEKLLKEAARVAEFISSIS